MSDKPQLSHVKVCNYQIAVEGRLDPSWTNWLGQPDIQSQKDINGVPLTILRVMMVDQSALRGLLNRLWDLNLILRSVHPVDPPVDNNSKEYSHENQ